MNSLLGAEYARTHDIRSLLDTLAALGEDVARLRSLDSYNEWAVAARYEPAEPDAAPVDRLAILHEVSGVVEHVRTLLEQAEP